MGSWHGGKGGDRRKSQVPLDEVDLRWELIDPKTSLARKVEIKKELEQIRNERKNNVQ